MLKDEVYSGDDDDDDVRTVIENVQTPTITYSENESTSQQSEKTKQNENTD